MMSGMINMVNLLVKIAPSWFFPVRVVMLVVIVLLALFLALVILLQPGNSEGLGAISGSADTFFGKNKAKNFESKLKRLTVYAAIAMIVLCVAFAILAAVFIG